MDTKIKIAIICIWKTQHLNLSIDINHFEVKSQRSRTYYSKLFSEKINQVIFKTDKRKDLKSSHHLSEVAKKFQHVSFAYERQLLAM